MNFLRGFMWTFMNEGFKVLSELKPKVKGKCPNKSNSFITNINYHIGIRLKKSPSLFISSLLNGGFSVYFFDHAPKNFSATPRRIP